MKRKGKRELNVNELELTLGCIHMYQHVTYSDTAQELGSMTITHTIFTYNTINDNNMD